MIITQTPLRVSLLGGNTDFPKYFKRYGGIVLTTTIDKYIYCIVKERFDKQIWVNYSKKEVVNNIQDIKHDIVREVLKLLRIKDSIEITFLSDIPSEGSGLGSSSAVTIGLLHALHVYKGDEIDQRQLAEEACKIEIEILKKPIGMQDQYAIAFGGTNIINFGKRITLTRVTCLNRSNLMLFYTGKTRKSEEVLSKMKLNKKILDKNKELVYLGISSNFLFLGDLLGEYWSLKKKLNSSVTNKTINEMYDRAIAAGALGGKIVGAGGGGFLLVDVETNKMEQVRKAVGTKELIFKLSDEGSRVIFKT